MADAPKTDIQKKIWETIIRRHLLTVGDVKAGGTFDDDLIQLRDKLQKIKNGSSKLHPSITGGDLTFEEMKAKRGQYTLTPADEELIIKDLTKKTGEERVVRSEHSLATSKHDKARQAISEKREDDWKPIEEKIRKKYAKDPKALKAEIEKTHDIFNKETEVLLAKHDSKNPKLNSTFTKQLFELKQDADALTQHKLLMALPEAERAKRYKELQEFWDEPLQNKDATDEQKSAASSQKKRLQQMAEEDGVIKPKLARGIAAVGGAVKKTVGAVKNAAVSAIPGTGPTVSPPSPVVRPVTTTNAVPPIADMGGAGVLLPNTSAPAASAPPPAGLPPPPSAAPAPAASTPPPANLPPPPSASGNQPPATPRVWTGPNSRAGDATTPPPATPAAPAGQGGYPAAGREGVVEVGNEGVKVAVEGDLVTGRKWEPKLGRTIPTVEPLESRPSGTVNTTPYGTTTPLDPKSGKGRSGVPVTDASGNRRVGFVSTQPSGKPVVPAPPVKNPSILADLVGPITESAKMIGGTVGKGTVDVVVGAANLIKKAVVSPSPQDILRGNQSAKPATPAPAKATPDTLPKYAYGYDPLTGKQTGGPVTSATYGDLNRRISSLRDNNLIPFLNGRHAAELRGELAGKHGAYDLETFIQKAVNRSGLFTPTEVGQVVKQLKSDPIFKGLVDAGMPVDAKKGPFKSGGAPKPVIKDKQGNVLPVGNSVPKATPPVETAADRLAKIRADEAQRIATEQARVAAEQAAETKRVAEATVKFTQENAALAAAEAERKAIVDALQNRSPAGNEPAFPAGTRFGAPLPFVGNSGVTRQDRLRQISAENKKGVTVDEVMLQRWLKGRTATSTPESQAATGKPAPYIRGMERGVKPPSAGARFAGQVGNVGAQGIGFLPDIMTAYALSRGGPISGSGQVLYPHEVTVLDGATYETAALEGLAKYHPMNAANNPDVTNRQRQEYIKNVMGKGEKNQWFNSDNDAWSQDLDDWAKRTGFVPTPMSGSQPVPQVILDAIRSQR